MRRRYSPPPAVLAVARALEAGPGPRWSSPLAGRRWRVARRAEAIVAALVDAGAVRRLRDRRVPRGLATAGRRAEQLVGPMPNSRSADRQKLDQMIIYGQTAMCRWRKLLEYFDGDASVEAMRPLRPVRSEHESSEPP